MSCLCYLLNHISCESLKGQIPLTKLYGVTSDIGMLMMYTLYYESHNQSLPSTSEEKHAFGVGFGGHVVMLSPNNSWILHPTRSYIDLLFNHLMISIPTGIYSQIWGSQWDPRIPNPSHLLNPIRILTNLSVNPWLIIIQMTSSVEPSSYPQSKG